MREGNGGKGGGEEKRLRREDLGAGAAQEGGEAVGVRGDDRPDVVGGGGGEANELDLVGWQVAWVEWPHAATESGGEGQGEGEEGDRRRKVTRAMGGKGGRKKAKGQGGGEEEAGGGAGGERRGGRGGMSRGGVAGSSPDREEHGEEGGEGIRGGGSRRPGPGEDRRSRPRRLHEDRGGRPRGPTGSGGIRGGEKRAGRR